MNQPGGSDDGNEGSDEESSSSSSVQVEDDLASFREQWQRELEISPKHNNASKVQKNSKEQSNDLGTTEDHLSVENKAKTLFLTGIEHEQNGCLYEAIQFYKRAVHLVPDVEFRLYESTKSKNRDGSENEERVDTVEGGAVDGNTTEDDINEDGEDIDLLAKLSRIVGRNHCVCYPRFEQSTTHLSALPMEIILYILRWVVSSELDFRSLETFSRVCRGFYISARDPEIWRLACVRVWGVNCGKYEPKFSSWREMYLHRPRLRYNGCYISRTTYIRHGENSFQDQFYRPWHLVEYCRYIRFFPGGRVLMLTSTDDAQSCVNALKNRVPKNSSALIGHYRLHDNYVTLVLKKANTVKDAAASERSYKRKKRKVEDDSGEKTFHVEFEIENHQKRANSQLAWLEYNIFTKYRNGAESTTSMSINARYPPCKFNRVKSYTQESEAPLQ